jgi:hypothetical protein
VRFDVFEQDEGEPVTMSPAQQIKLQTYSSTFSRLGRAVQVIIFVSTATLTLFFQLRAKGFYVL